MRSFALSLFEGYYILYITMGKKTNYQSRKNRRELANMLMDFFLANPNSVYSKTELYNEFSLKAHPSRMVMVDILEDLVMCGYLSLSASGGYCLKARQDLKEGVVTRHGKEYSFLADGDDTPIYLDERNSATALNGDRVSATVTFNRKANRQEAIVGTVITRAKDTFVGVLSVDKHFAFLETTDKYLPYDIFIPKASLGSARNGDKVIAKIVEWPSRNNRSPVGKIVDVLGATGDNTTEMHAILAEFGLPYCYPENLEKLADKIPADINQSDIDSREDFRQVPTFTIDPRDAKDFDDALSIRRLDDGLWEVGVHIADVTYYVKEGSPIDEEAYNRATSIYLVDRTIPMLPEKLCNYICSLRPDEDKLAYSVIFKMDDSGAVVDCHIARTVIRSNRRFMYEEVQAILEQNGEASPEDLTKPGFHPVRVKPNADGSPVGEFAKELILLNRIAKKLRVQRTKNGAIEFEREEVRFELDDKGHPISTYAKVAMDAHKLVEEFMLLANRYVAQRIGMVPAGVKAKVFPYRIHDVPDPEKLEKLAGYVARFGYRLDASGSKKSVSKDINAMLAKAQGSREQELIEDITLRSMMKARYSTHNIGHYGLMFKYYTHFTSPIRRYPDQMVHRLLTRYLAGGRSVNRQKCEEQCEHSSAMEQLAANAERASIKYKQVEFLADKIGQEFAGKVSGTTDFGLYVELAESKCEGAVPMRTLRDDYYYFDDRAMCLRGRRTHRSINLGDPVKVRVTSANLEKRQLDFELIEINGRKLKK